MTRTSPHRLVIPFTALLAVVLTVVLFHTFDGRMTSEHAVYASATLAFLATAAIGFAFKPLLGE
jgi:hypothetical protein